MQCGIIGSYDDTVVVTVLTRTQEGVHKTALWRDFTVLYFPPRNCAVVDLNQELLCLYVLTLQFVQLGRTYSSQAEDGSFNADDTMAECKLQ